MMPLIALTRRALWSLVLTRKLPGGRLWEYRILICAIALGLIALVPWTTSPRTADALVNCSVADLSVDSTELALLSLINNYRAQNGVPPLTMSANLNRAASWMARDMALNNRLSHTDSLGRDFGLRLRQCEVNMNASLGETLGAGQTTAQSIFDGWRNSPGHRSIMLSGTYVQVGLARYFGSTWYWAADFSSFNDGTNIGGGGPAPKSGSISASPNPCRISGAAGSCSTTLNWSTQNSTAAEVTVQLGSGSEALFAAGTSGSAAAPWIGRPPSQYTFRLYDRSAGSRALLSQVVVTSTAAASGTISASPNPCLIGAGGLCSTTISWGTQNAAGVEITVQMPGGPEVLFAGGPSGSANAPWIANSPSHYTFRLYDRSSGSRVLLSSVSVSGRR
jgi:hypothetical protein